jgi:hypothetical protein
MVTPAITANESVLWFQYATMIMVVTDYGGSYDVGGRRQMFKWYIHSINIGISRLQTLLNIKTQLSTNLYTSAGGKRS